jgi:curved DNA-binding protein CbpA
MAGRDYYADLGLTQYATTAQIKTAFHALAKQHHPDKSGSDDSSQFRRAHEAYEVLSDDTTRAEYDRTHQRPRMHYQTDQRAPSTRTAAYDEQEAEEAERKAWETPERPQRYSPPPYKPVRKPMEPSWAYYMGKAYQAWEKRDAAYRKRHPEYYEP